MTRYKNHSARVDPAVSPLPVDIQDATTAIMRGNDPLVPFTTLARDRRLFFKLFNSGLLDRGHLTIRQREIVIDRVTAQCGAEYEWGVHVAVYATKAGLNEQQIASLVGDGASDDHGAMRTGSSSGSATACTIPALSTTTCGRPSLGITRTRRSSSCSCSLAITAW